MSCICRGDTPHPGWKLVSLPALLASLVGCDADAATAHEGRLDLVIRPDSAAVSSRPAQGRFVLHDQQGRFVDRIEVVNLYQTSNVALPEGTYSLEWQPALAFESEGDIAARLSEVSLGALPVSISTGRVTTVNVRATLIPSSDGALAALGDDMPSVQILIARH
jgi:hypothetical protein